jgi:hypothetical protein
MRHYKSIAPITEPDEVIETSWGDSEPGVTMLDGFGRCPCCGTDFSAYVGLYHCLRCSEGE